MRVCGAFLCTAERWDMGERARAITVIDIIPGQCEWGESALSSVIVSSHSSVRAPFIKNISFMIASGTQCNEKWAWQRAPLMKQRETFSHGALLVGLGYPGHSARLCEIWFCIFPAVLLYIILMCLFNWVCLSVHCWCLNERTSMERDRKFKKNSAMLSLGLPAG